MGRHLLVMLAVLAAAVAGTAHAEVIETSDSVGGYRPGGLRGLASPVDFVVRGQLLRLKNYVETGRPN